MLRRSFRSSELSLTCLKGVGLIQHPGGGLPKPRVPKTPGGFLVQETPVVTHRPDSEARVLWRRAKALSFESAAEG